MEDVETKRVFRFSEDFDISLYLTWKNCKVRPRSTGAKFLLSDQNGVLLGQFRINIATGDVHLEKSR